ncbi:MAG: hypothetical protein ABIH23_35385 [bacterium]
MTIRHEPNNQFAGSSPEQGGDDSEFSTEPDTQPMASSTELETGTGELSAGDPNATTESGSGVSLDEKQQTKELWERALSTMAEDTKSTAAIVKAWLKADELSEPELSTPDSDMHEASIHPGVDLDVPPEQQGPEIRRSPSVPIDSGSIRDALASGDEHKRERVIERALRGHTYAEEIFAELAACGDGQAMVAILRLNLFEDYEGSLYREDAVLISQMARYLLKEYPNGGPVTEFVKGLMLGGSITAHHQNCLHLAGLLMNALIRHHGACIAYRCETDRVPVVVLGEGRDECRLPLSELSRVISMLFIHRPILACKCFGGVFDELSQKVSVLFEGWMNDPIIAHAFCLQTQSGDLRTREQVCRLVEESLDAGLLDPDRFEYASLPGFVEDILPTIASRSEKGRRFLRLITEAPVSRENDTSHESDGSHSKEE